MILPCSLLFNYAWLSVASVGIALLAGARLVPYRAVVTPIRPVQMAVQGLPCGVRVVQWDIERDVPYTNRYTVSPSGLVVSWGGLAPFTVRARLSNGQVLTGLVFASPVGLGSPGVSK